MLSHCDNEMTWPALLYSLSKTHLLDEGENEKILPPLPSFVKHTFNILFHRVMGVRVTVDFRVLASVVCNVALCACIIVCVRVCVCLCVCVACDAGIALSNL